MIMFLRRWGRFLLFRLAAMENATVLHLAHAPSPPSVPDAGCTVAADVVRWLDELLDAARGRRDAPLARLIAGLMDDLANVTRG